MVRHLAAATLALMATMVFSNSGFAENRTVDIPPLDPAPDEVVVQPLGPIPDYCLSNVEMAKQISPGSTGDDHPYFTHSPKWGDIVRFDLVGNFMGEPMTTRIVCTYRGISLIAPDDSAKPLPSRQ